MSSSRDPRESLVTAAWTAGQRAWPTVALPRERFDAHVEAGDVAGGALTEHGPDLYLAAACAAGDSAAIKLFDDTFMPLVPSYVARLAPTPETLDEIRQQVRIRLLTGPAPKIAQFTGSGPLGAWVRVATLRVALNHLQDRSGGVPTGDDRALDGLVAQEASPELQAIRTRWRPTFQAALERCLTGLSPRDKTLLRMHFIDGLAVDAIGAAFRVHRATAARWLVAIRRRVLDDLRRELSVDLRSTTTEVRSLLNVFGREIEVTLDRVLR